MKILSSDCLRIVNIFRLPPRRDSPVCVRLSCCVGYVPTIYYISHMYCMFFFQYRGRLSRNRLSHTQVVGWECVFVRMSLCYKHMLRTFHSAAVCCGLCFLFDVVRWACKCCCMRNAVCNRARSCCALLPVHIATSRHHTIQWHATNTHTHTQIKWSGTWRLAPCYTSSPSTCVPSQT